MVGITLGGHVASFLGTHEDCIAVRLGSGQWEAGGSGTLSVMKYNAAGVRGAWQTHAKA